MYLRHSTYNSVLLNSLFGLFFILELALDYPATLLYHSALFNNAVTASYPFFIEQIADRINILLFYQHCRQTDLGTHLNDSAFTSLALTIRMASRIITPLYIGFDFVYFFDIY